ERLVDVLDRLGLLRDGDRERAEPDRLPTERHAECMKQGAVDLVEAELGDLEQRQRGARGGVVDLSVAADLRVVTDTLEQTVGDARGPARASTDLLGTPGSERHAEDARRAVEDRDEIVGRVVVEARQEPEPVSKGPRDHPAARGRADQREPWEVE